ncbi:facilitated trehalose transporter Tret1-2 homolog [Sitophilus oryzae]|uniref:Facilitated trehalose transporter Tret1-2 homolog n=1 Tax=Sitophilus oryzae TaxID=7048 RepID=A0A6J2XR69_SITOR|nr:facilitated trehalose transporter Tret1-2 homolog [Sitophilus oryzae]
MIFIWMPESPYYYVMKGQDEKASASLKWLLRKENFEPDFLQLKADVNRQISEKGTGSDLFTIKSNRRALAACILRILYVQYIFEKSGSLTVNPHVSAMYFSGLLCIVMTGLVFTEDRIGRRKSMVISCMGPLFYFKPNPFILICRTLCLIWLGLLSSLIAGELYSLSIKGKAISGTNVAIGFIAFVGIESSKKTIFLAGLITYVFFYSVGLGLLPSLMAGELYSVSIKGKALSVTNVAMGFIVFVGTFTFKSLNSVTGLYAPFLVFACCTFCSFVLSFFIIPETKGKTLEEIQQMLKGNSIKM